MKVAGLFLLALLVAETCLSVHALVCKSDVRKMRRALRKRLYDRRLAHTVRLFFHDCVGESCDGCINFDHKSNLGEWQDTINMLNDLYANKNYASFGVSYADFYTLAAIVAIEQGVKNANADLPQSERVRMPTIPFQYGREDCETAPYSSVEQPLPPAHFNHTELTAFFGDMFGFDTEETVAIMGGHTLGGATGKNASGWLGLWKENDHEANKFDNRYYTMLVRDDLDWEQIDKAPESGFHKPRWQWEGFNAEGNLTSFMFQADLATYLEASIDSEGKGSCGFGTCPVNAEGEAAVLAYDNAYEDWLEDFRDVFLKMSAHGVTGRLRNPRTC